MQWRRKRRFLHVIGSAHHALLIKQYRDDGGVCSGNEDDGDMERDSASPNGSYARAANGGHQQQHQQRLLRGGKGRPAHQHPRHRPYYQHDNGQPLVTTEKKTFNEEEYTKITTPRQDVLFKKGYLGRKRPTPAPDATAPTNNTAPTAAPADVTNGNLRPDGSVVQNGEPLDNDQGYEVIAQDEQPQIIYTNGYVDQNGIYYINGGYELYDPYSGGVTVVVGPAPHFPGPGGGPPVLAAVPCQPLPLQPLEWFNPAFVPYVPAPPIHDPSKRFSIDSQNCSPHSSESTGPPGSPQEYEEGSEQHVPGYQLQGHHNHSPAPPPPAYVYPGYMFGPPVYNMNGVTVQGAPPQAPQGDAAATSKRRKKKRRRRRRRGGAEDGSEESSSEEKELEEPMSITSQESSSQELESDSKQSPTVEQDATVLTQQADNTHPVQADQEKTISVCSIENTDNTSVVSQQELTKTDSERQDWRIDSGDTHLVNGVLHSDSSDTSCRGETSEKEVALPSQPSSSSSPPPSPPPLSSPLPYSSPPAPTPIAQESRPDIEINGYSSDVVTEKVDNKNDALERNNVETPSPLRIETLNNAANKIKSGKPLQDQKKKQETKKSNSKNACNGNVNAKQPGGKIRKENRQRNLHNGHVPNLISKMDGNENIDQCREQVEKSSRTKATSSSGSQQNLLQQELVSSECSTRPSKTEAAMVRCCSPSMDHAQTAQKLADDKTEKNQPPNKPVRKDLCKSTKLSSASVATPLHPEPSRNIQTTHVAEHLEDVITTSTSITEHISNITQTSVPQSPVTLKSFCVGEHVDTVPTQDEKIGTLVTGVCPVEQPEIKDTSEYAGSEIIARIQEEKRLPSAYLGHFSSAVNVSSTEDEREAEPPPIPPPRRKRWRTSVRRQSLERAPTPGRELDVTMDIPESVSDESSLSSSTQSEESVIELLSSMPTSPDAEAKTRSSEDDDVIYASKPVEKFECLEIIQAAIVTEVTSSKTQMPMIEVETFADVLSKTIILEAVEDAVLECSKNSHPITHAVTRWLRSQSPEEVLSLPSCEHSGSEIDDTDISGESTEDISDVRHVIQTGPKNVHRNPLPASSLKISDTLKNANSFDDVGRRVAKKSGYQCKFETKTVKEAAKKIAKVSEEYKETCVHKLSKSIEQNKLPKNYVCSGVQKKLYCPENYVDDDSFLSDSSECEGEWDLWDCRSMKPSPLRMLSNKVEEFGLPSESPDDRRSTMCDPTLSVAKYYCLGAAVKSTVQPEDNSDTMSELGSEEEVDAMYHFRDEMGDTEQHLQTLASEFACSCKPLPKHWAVDPVTVMKNDKVDNSSFEKKYFPDSGVQSEESGDEVMVGSDNAQRINMKANLLHHQSAILMSHLQGDGPFPCGGICCILQ